MSDESREGGFIWADGAPVNYINWNDGEPNNAGDEDCVVMWGDNGGVWNDVPCNLRFNAICEKKGKRWKCDYWKLSLRDQFSIASKAHG